LAPALRSTTLALVPVLKDEIVPGTTRSRARSALVVAQVTLSLLALACAGLFLRSHRAALAADPGFRDPRQVLLVTTDTRLAGLRDSAGAVVVDRLLARIRALPGVQRISLTSKVPLTFWSNSSQYTRV